jgi:hypothetical protein
MSEVVEAQGKLNDEYLKYMLDQVSPRFMLARLTGAVANQSANAR